MIGVILLHPGCGNRGYTFATTATYDVPALGFRADVTAKGSVVSGAALSEDGTFRAILTRMGNPAVPVAILQTSNRVASVPSNQTITYTIGTNAPVTLPWGSVESEISLVRILAAAGFTNAVPEAIGQAAHAIGGTALGPKSTATGSSSEVIVVKAVPTFKR